MKRYEDYEEMGDHFGLDYMGPPDPPTVHDPVLWRCRNCRREFRRSYRQLRRRRTEGRHGCRCRGRQSLSREDYKQFALRLGIRWVGTHLPPTTRTPTHWKTMGRVFSASLQELRWGIPQRLRQEIFDD